MGRFLILIGIALASLAGAARAETPCAALAGVTLPHASVTAAIEASAGTVVVCKIEVTSRPTADSDIRIEVWIPKGGAWNGRYLQLGNGGLAGSINTAFLQVLAARGFAVAGTDDGHQAQGTDGRWALGHPEKIVDFGWRALKETTEAAKALIRAYKGEPASHAYFAGCSDGGREALMEAQRFPDDFDGIVAGAPAANFTGLLTLAAYDAQVLSKPGAWLPADKLGTLEAAAQNGCGRGFFIADPPACRFDPRTVICPTDQDSPDCVTAAQADAAAALYRGLLLPDGRLVNPGYTPGEEDEAGGWVTWITGEPQAEAQNALIWQFGRSFWRYFVFGDPNYDITKLDLNHASEAAAKLAPILNATDPDLRRFRAHGGKLIQYHGWNDPAIPALNSVVYYGQVRSRMPDAADFYRLYLIPGTLHCGGGPGPSGVDWVQLLQDWVEKGKAPEAIVATGGEALGPHRQVLCPYPDRGATDTQGTAQCLAEAPVSGCPDPEQIGTLTGKDAASFAFHCVAPPKPAPPANATPPPRS